MLEFNIPKKDHKEEELRKRSGIHLLKAGDNIKERAWKWTYNNWKVFNKNRVIMKSIVPICLEHKVSNEYIMPVMTYSVKHRN